MSRYFDDVLLAAFNAGVRHGMVWVMKEPTEVTTMSGMRGESDQAYARWRREWAGLDECTCPMTDPKYWLSAASCGYGSGYEPGSMQEWDPECPVHPPSASVDLGDGLEAVKQEQVEEVRAMLSKPDGTCGYDGVMHDPADHLPKDGKTTYTWERR